MSDNFSPYQEQRPETRVVYEKNPTNGLGLAGFILAICAIILFWAPFLNFILWLLGLIFSAIGVFKQPKGFAIAGLAISLIGIVILLLAISTLATMIGLSRA